MLHSVCLLTVDSVDNMRWWLLASLIGCFLSKSTNGAPQNSPSIIENTVEAFDSNNESTTELNQEQVNNEFKLSEPLKEQSSVLNDEKNEQERANVTKDTMEELKQATDNSPQEPEPVKPTTEIISTTTHKPVKPIKPLAEGVVPSIPGPSTAAPERRYPCRCGSGICSCCTGLVLENFNFPIRSRACANITYEPDEFAFNFKLLYNNRILYDTRMSAKNPRPVCIPINRYFGVKMCAKLSNVYMSGRNIHACLNLEGFWDDESAFNYSFNCFRIGSNGVAVVRPEDGGGLPPPPDGEEQTDEDYDDSARGWTSQL